LQRLIRPAQVIIVGSVMFTFISYWRTAAIVLCDLASTSYYIGGIVEQSIGPAAPWFILAVMVLAFIVGLVYIESCSMFVRGGVYRVVREALGGFAAKIAVSALMFDYILTGPISGVSAGQYIIGLGLDSLALIDPSYRLPSEIRLPIRRWGSVAIACAITLYFFRQNVRGIHESSEKALKIVKITTVMAVLMMGWCALTLVIQGPANRDIPFTPDLRVKTETLEGGKVVPKINPLTRDEEDPLGLLDEVIPKSWTEGLRQPPAWLSIFGLVGIMIAFGHSVLAMSGLETLAQVYREVASPKLPNFKKAAFIVFAYALVLTGTISFMAVLIIPNDVRMKEYSENLIGGLAMNVIGPVWARLLLNAFVTVVGFLILSGACNTSIIGSNGVLNRVAEDGVLSDWFRKPHPKYGTSYRILVLICGLQLLTIVASRGNVYLLGEAYAFGVIWSFVFQAVSMVVLRFKDPRPREFKVPLNFRVGPWEIPFGLLLILLVLLSAALLNFFTKEVATVGGLVFSAIFFCIFTLSERYHDRQRRGREHEHLEVFNQETTPDVSLDGLGLKQPYRKLVAIRSPQNLYMLEKALAETDPENTGVVVMTAKIVAAGPLTAEGDSLDHYDQQLMTAVVQFAEKAGKEVHPLIVPTNNPLYAVLRTARDLKAQELVVGASNKYNADEQLEVMALYWSSLHEGMVVPLTIRVLSKDRDMYLDLNGGSRIPKITERKARTVAELRAAGVGIDRVLLVYDATPASGDLFQEVLTLLDGKVELTLVPLGDAAGPQAVHGDQERAKNLGRKLDVHKVTGDPGPEIVRVAQEGHYDLIILSLPSGVLMHHALPLEPWADHVMRHAHCRVFLTTPPVIPQEVIDKD